MCCCSQIMTSTIELQYEVSNNMVGAIIKGSDEPALTRSLIRAFTNGLNIL